MGGALITTLLTAFCPTLLAHHALVTADALASFLLHLSLWALWWTLHKASVVSVLAAATTLGLLLCSGPAALLYIPASLLLLFLRLLSPTSIAPHSWRADKAFSRSATVHPPASPISRRTVTQTFFRRSASLGWQMLLMAVVATIALAVSILIDSPSANAHGRPPDICSGAFVWGGGRRYRTERRGDLKVRIRLVLYFIV